MARFKSFGWLAALLLLTLAAAPKARVNGIGCRVTSPFTMVAPFAETAIAFDTETYDPVDMHDLAVNRARVTIPADGIYHFTLNYSLTNALGGATVFVFARKNGAAHIEQLEFPENPGLMLSASLSGENAFVAGDYLEFTYLIIAGGYCSISGSAAVRKVD